MLILDFANGARLVWRAQERDSTQRHRGRRGGRKESGVRGQEFGDLTPQASSLLRPQMDTDRKGKPDLTKESSTEEGPGRTGRDVGKSKRQEGTHRGAAEDAEGIATLRATENHGDDRHERLRAGEEIEVTEN